MKQEPWLIKILFQKLPFYKKIENRKNIILFWDNLSDTSMIKNLQYKNIIKIWFLNENIKNNIDSFKKIYDIIILNDWSAKFLNKFFVQLF